MFLCQLNNSWHVLFFHQPERFIDPNEDHASSLPIARYRCSFWPENICFCCKQSFKLLLHKSYYPPTQFIDPNEDHASALPVARYQCTFWPEKNIFFKWYPLMRRHHFNPLLWSVIQLSYTLHITIYMNVPTVWLRLSSLRWVQSGWRVHFPIALIL